MKDTKVIGFKAGESEARRAVIAPDSAASISRANIVYGVSEGEIEGFVEQLRSVILDNTPVQSSSGDINLPDVEVQTRWGTNDQTHLEGFPAVVNEVGYSGVEIVSDYTFIHYINDLNVDAARIRLQWGKIFKSNPDNGDMGGYRIDYAIDVQTDGAGFVEMIRSALDDKTSSGYERTHQIQLPEAEEGWEIRIRRLTPNTNVEHIGDKMYIRAVGEIIDLKLRYPNTAIIGLKFNAERFTNIPKADFRLKGKKIKVPANYDPVARTYATVGEGTTGGVWNGVFKTAYSNNPAWIFYDIMLSPRYGLGTRIDASMVNKWALYGIARHCDTMVPDGQGGMEPRFACNVYLSSQFEAFDCITQLASVFRGLMHWDGSAIVVHPDTPEDPTFTYTRANIVGDFVYSGTRARDRHSIFTVAFDDPRNNYKTEKEVVSDTNAIAELGVRIGNLSAFGCTSRGQAQRVGRAALLKEQNETRMVNFAVGLDGFIPVTGKIIEIADNILAGRAIGGRIAHVSADLKVVSLDRKIEAQAGDRLAVNNEEGIQESREILSVAGAVVTVTSPFTSLAAENVWALETEDLDLMRFRVLSVTENKGEDGSLNFTISAIQHNKDTQEIADNSSHFEAPIFSKIEIYTQVPVESLTIASENIINQGIDLTNVVISWPQAKGAVRYELEWRRDKGSWIKTPDQYGNEFTIENVYHGNYAARIVAVNAIDVKSLPTLSPITPINSKFTEPAVLASFTATGSQFGMIFNWSFPNTGAENAAQTEIRVAYLSDYSDEKLLGNYAYPLNRAELSGLHGNLKIYAKARIIDRNGVEGAWTPWIFGTTLADPDVLLDVLNGHIGLGAIDNELAGKLEVGQEALDEAILAKQLADNAALAASNAATAASTAQASASAAQTTANTAKADALAANTKVTANATALTQEVTDRKAAVTAETNARNTAITAEATARATALTKEATDRAAAITAESNTLKADSAAKVKALKDEVDPKIVTLQNGITQITTDYKAADTVVVGQLNAYKTSNNSAVASVLQKAESAVSTGSTNSSAISAINGQITTINGTLSTKLDASVISGYYTKGQTDAKAAEIAAGKVEEFSASLVVGTDNFWQFRNNGSSDYGSRSVTNVTADMQHQKVTITGVASGMFSNLWQSLRESDSLISLDDPMSFSLMIKAPLPFIRLFLYVFGQANPIANKLVQVVPNEWTLITENSIRPSAAGNATYGGLIGIRFLANDNGLSSANDLIGLEFEVRNPLLQIGTKAGAYQKPRALLENAIGANSTAIQNTDASVVQANGRIDAANAATTTLTGRVNTVEGQVATKAEAAALTALTTRVSSAEGVNTSQGSAITTLENSVNHATTGLASKASSSALTAVDNKVTSANGRIDTTNSNVTNLTGRVSTVEGAVSTKAEAAALTALTTRVTNAEGINTSQGTAITSLQNTINHATTGLSTKASTTALNTTNSEVSRVNGVVVAQGTQLTQLASDISTINGTLATKADATALNSLTTRVDNAEGVNTAQGTSITNLNSSLVTTNNNVTAAQTAATNAMNAAGEKGKVLFASTAPAVADRLPQNLWIDTTGGTNTPKRWNGTAWVVVTDKVATDALAAANAATTALATKADASAVTSLTTRVTAAEGVNTSQGTAITSLENSVNSATTGLATKASSTALTAVDNKVTAANGRIDTTNSNVTALTGRVSTVEGAVATKAEAAALTALTTRVTNAEGVNTSQGSSITSLQNTVNHATTGLATKASTAALTATNSEVSRVNGVVTGHSTQLTQLASDITTINGTLATKANASALNDIYTKTQADDKATEIAAGEINKFNAALSIGTENLITQALWQTPAFSAVNQADRYEFKLVKSVAPYTAWAQFGTWTNIQEGTKIVLSFKIKALDATPLTIGGHTNGITPDGTGVLVYLDGVFVPNTNFYTGSTTIPNDGKYHLIVVLMTKSGTGSDHVYIQPNRPTRYNQPVNCSIKEVMLSVGTAYVEWDAPKEFVQNQLNVNSTAIESTNAEVSRVDGRVTTEANRITSLTGRVSTVEGAVSTKADASALNSLTTRVATEEGKSTSQGSAITSLQNTINHATTGLSAKASSAALTAVDNKVTAVDGRVNATNSNVATLTGRVSTVEGGLATKAEVSAVNALTTRVGNVEGGLSTQASNTTALKAAMDVVGTIAPTSLEVLDLTSLDPNIYYPVVFALSGNIRTRIQISAPLIASENGKPAWGMHAGGFSCMYDWETNASAWGSQPTSRIILTADNMYSEQPPAIDIGQLGNSSREHVFLRGGAKYTARYSNAVISTQLVTASTTFTQQVIAPKAYDAAKVIGTALNGKASAAALTTTNTEVSRIDGVVVGQSTQLTNLNAAIAGKADASALSSLTTRVAAEEGKSTSQGTAITNLENAVNNATTGLSSKASAQALTTLNNQVQHSTTGLSAVNTKVDNLKATVENTTNGLASKASSSAVDTLSNKVNHSTTGLDAIASKTTVLTSDVAQALDAVTIRDTRNTNQPPSWYWANYPSRVLNEFKQTAAIGVSGFFGGTFCNLETKVYWNDPSGGDLIQTATSSVDPSLYVQRRSNGTAAWTAWAQPLKDIRDGLDLKASASALSSLTVRVTNAEGVNTSQATQLTNLTSTANGHTTSIQTQTQVTDGIQAKFTVKINNNGYATGFGLISTNNDAVPSSAFLVDADAFAVGKAGAGTKPFVVVTAGQTIEGITYPAGGTYINSAKIADLTVTTAKIANLGVTTAKIGDGQITTAKIGDLQVDTLKIKDNAVTVPIGVKFADITVTGADLSSRAPTGGVPKTFEASVSYWETAFGDLGSITLNRSGGKVMLSCALTFISKSTQNLSLVTGSGTGASVEDRMLSRLVLSIYKGSTLIGRTYGMPTSTAGNAGVDYVGTYAVVAAIDDSASVGNTTYSMHVGIGYLGNNTSIAMNIAYASSVFIIGRSLTAVELKK